MSFKNTLVGSSSRRKSGGYNVVMPKGKHKATVVWLHDHGDVGSSWSKKFGNCPFYDIKWICPTASIRGVTKHGGYPSTAWFDEADPDAGEIFPKVVEDLDDSATHIAKLLSTEPSDVKLVIGGFGMGAVCALYSAICFALGRFGNGTPYPVHLNAVVGLSGWIPLDQGLGNKILGSEDSIRRAASLPILICHGRDDKIYPWKVGERSSEIMSSCGFGDVEFKIYEGIQHHTLPKELIDVCLWLNAKFGG